ncbi:MAG TPA: hypothetical protein DCL08_02045 [Anaerolineaceae bacterium]|jgi:hypothetical protein|nr:hypothetical protein [Anaerolineaceae bacterium]
MAINANNSKNQSENAFSLEENLRQRDYYEKYYEDLAAHASKMDEIGQHEIAEADREEMAYVSGVLGDLTREKFENYDNRQDIQQADTKEQGQINQNQVDDIPQEDLIPVDKSHFTEDALEAQAHADEQLAAEEAAMDEKIQQFYAEQEQDSGMQNAENQVNQADEAVNEQTTGDSETAEAAQEEASSSEEEDYSYGYGM